MQICHYQEQYKHQIIDLILHIQNEEGRLRKRHCRKSCRQACMLPALEGSRV